MKGVGGCRKGLGQPERPSDLASQVAYTSCLSCMEVARRMCMDAEESGCIDRWVGIWRQAAVLPRRSRAGWRAWQPGWSGISKEGAWPGGRSQRGREAVPALMWNPPGGCLERRVAGLASPEKGLTLGTGSQESLRGGCSPWAWEWMALTVWPVARSCLRTGTLVRGAGRLR